MPTRHHFPKAFHSVTTATEQELSNVRKCLEADFTRVALVVPEQRRTGSFEKALRKVRSETEFARVRVVTPDGLFAFIEELDAKDATHSETIRGYKVKVSHRAVDQSTKEERRAMLTKW